MTEIPKGITVLDHFKFLWDGSADKYRYIVCQGGAGSGKSKAICQFLTYMFLTYDDLNIYVVRASMPTLKRSVYLGKDPSIIEELSLWGVPAYEWLNKTEQNVTNPINHSRISFVGLDDPEKIKSVNANYIWLEEATELSIDKFNQLNLRMRRTNPIPGKNNQMFITYNPISYNNWVITTFQTNVAPEREPQIYRSFSNFSQNKFVSIDAVKEWLITAKNSRQFYLTYILGIPGIPTGQIYPHIKYLPADEWGDHVWECTPYYGIDWGFIDPMVLMECRDVVNEESGETTTYIRCLFYETKKITANLINRMKELSVSKSAMIYCDYAEQDRKAELINAGYTCLNARKNINAGISHVQGCTIVCDNANEYGKKVEQEFTGYTWQKDAEDSEKYIDKPIETDNHACDAIRYALFTHHMVGHDIEIGTLDMTPIDDLLDTVSVNASEFSGNQHTS